MEVACHPATVFIMVIALTSPPACISMWGTDTLTDQAQDGEVGWGWGLHPGLLADPITGGPRAGKEAATKRCGPGGAGAAETSFAHFLFCWGSSFSSGPSTFPLSAQKTSRHVLWGTPEGKEPPPPPQGKAPSTPHRGSLPTPSLAFLIFSVTSNEMLRSYLSHVRMTPTRAVPLSREQIASGPFPAR